MALENMNVEDGCSVRNQYVASIVMNMMTFVHGAALGWVSPSLPLLSSPASPLETPLTPQQAALVASILCIGGCVTTPFVGLLAERLGRKTTALIFSVPYAICWLLKLTWPTAEGLILARVMAGLGGAGFFMLAPLYASEVGSVHIRGALSSLLVFSINVGIVAMFAMGAYVDYYTAISCVAVVPFLFFVLMLKMPETPTYLVKKNRDEDAAKAIAWLRSVPVDSEVVKKVLANLKYEVSLASYADHPNDQIKDSSIISEKDVISIKTSETSAWRLLFFSKPTRRAFAMCYFLLCVQSFVGIFAVVTYASDIFADAGSDISPATATIVVGFLQLVGSVCASSLIEKAGRKILLVCSCLVVSLSMATMGSFFYAHHVNYDVSSLGWVPVTALSLNVATFAVGIGPIPYVLQSEIFMVQARGLSTSILLSWVWFTSFLIAQFYMPAVELLGNYVIFWFFSAVGMLGVIVTLIFLPETKGKPLDEILALFGGEGVKKRSKGMSSRDENGELL